jgi:hypothetical protein
MTLTKPHVQGDGRQEVLSNALCANAAENLFQYLGNLRGIEFSHSYNNWILGASTPDRSSE